MTVAKLTEPGRAWLFRRELDRRIVEGADPASSHERAQMLDLARLLCEEETVSARGIARVEELLTDGRSPLYYPAPRGALAAALRHARVTLLLG